MTTDQLGCEIDWEVGVASGKSSETGRCNTCGSFFEECNCGPDMIFCVVPVCQECVAALWVSESHRCAPSTYGRYDSET